MLFWLLEHFRTDVGNLAAFEKITFRGALAAGVALFVALLLGPRMIAALRRRFREPNLSDSPKLRELHQGKQFTPTMGGLFLVAGLLGAMLLLADLANPFVQAALFVTVGLGLLGAVDDYVKLRSATRGVSARTKLFFQTLIASVAAVWLYSHHLSIAEHLGHSGPLDLWIPLADVYVPIGWGFVPLAIVVMVGSSNAVNLTDGLDGLAGGCLIAAIGAMAAVAYAAGHAEIAQYLGIARVPGAGELAVLAASMIGGLLGFLWFNCHPAQVFMGDTGSLPLGGLLGLIAVATRQEILLLVIGGVFVVEALSVLIQVGVYKWRRRRVFLCAPLHHHFQFKGTAESQIVVRFWIAAAVCAVVGVACLKITIYEETNRPTSPSVLMVDAKTASPPKNGERNLWPSATIPTQYPVQSCEYLEAPDGRSAARLEIYK